MKPLLYRMSLFLTLFCCDQAIALPSNFPSDAEMEGHLVQMHQVYTTHMIPFSKAYHEFKKNEKTQYKHSALKTLFDQLPRCSHKKQKTGHLHYELDDFPLHFGLGHINENVDSGAFKGQYEILQPFMNFLCNDIFYLPMTPRSERTATKRRKVDVINPFTPRPIQEQIAVYKQYVQNKELFEEKMKHYRELI